MPSACRQPPRRPLPSLVHDGAVKSMPDAHLQHVHGLPRYHQYCNGNSGWERAGMQVEDSPGFREQLCSCLASNVMLIHYPGASRDFQRAAQRHATLSKRRALRPMHPCATATSTAERCLQGLCYHPSKRAIVFEERGRGMAQPLSVLVAFLACCRTARCLTAFQSTLLLSDHCSLLVHLRDEPLRHHNLF